VLVPSCKAQASLSVAVRVRPTLKSEPAAAGSSSSKRDIIRVMDGKIVVVLDPDEAKDYLDQVQNRTKEKRYTFDVAYDTQVCVGGGGGRSSVAVSGSCSSSRAGAGERRLVQPTGGSSSSSFEATHDECSCSTATALAAPCAAWNQNNTGATRSAHASNSSSRRSPAAVLVQLLYAEQQCQRSPVGQVQSTRQCNMFGNTQLFSSCGSSPYSNILHT
jgi:hypothetical protein